MAPTAAAKPSLTPRPLPPTVRLTFSRALKLGYQRGELAKLPREKPNEPQHYALAPELRDDP